LREHGHEPLVVALTGTDLYGDIHTSDEARHSLEVDLRTALYKDSTFVDWAGVDRKGA